MFADSSSGGNVTVSLFDNATAQCPTEDTSNSTYCLHAIASSQGFSATVREEKTALMRSTGLIIC
jgi:hypothetical protein